MGRGWRGVFAGIGIWLILAGVQARPARAQGQADRAMEAACEKDQRRLLDLLGIGELRPAANNDANSPNATNYDETKANVYPTLPDPLTMKDGKRVETAQEWWERRRPEIVEDFDREVLGRMPKGLMPGIIWEVLSRREEEIGGVAVVTKRLAGRVNDSADRTIKVEIDLVVTTPAKATGAVPVIMQLGFPMDFKMAAERPPAGKDVKGLGYYGQEWQEAVLKRGWGFAVLSPNSYQADNGAGLTKGIIGLMNKGEPRGLEDWGVLKAWAWGASQALNYLEVDPAVDARQVGIEGHSRMGKAALVAMAYDRRFAIGYISSSGEGGAKLYRHIFGEQITDLAAPREYHWMAGNFLKYAGPLTAGNLPVDNHELIALVAPRPLFIGSGSSAGDGYTNKNGDAWADPTGMFLAEAAAGPVYRLLGKKDLGTKTMPPVGTALIEGDLGFREHPDGHTPTPNWATFLEFAGRYLHGPGAK